MGGGKRNRRKAEEKPKKSEREIRDVSRVAKRNLLSRIRKLFQNDPISLSLPLISLWNPTFRTFRARTKRFELGMPIIRTRGPDYILGNYAYINSWPFVRSSMGFLSVKIIRRQWERIYRRSMRVGLEMMHEPRIGEYLSSLRLRLLAFSRT